MHPITPSEKDTATETLEKRLWDAADQFRANSGLKSQEYSAPVLGLIFLRFTELRFAAQCARLEKAANRVVIGILLLASILLPAMAASGLFTDERGELLLNGASFHGVGVNYYDAFTRTLGKAARANYDAGFRELAARKIPFARLSVGGFWPQDWGQIGRASCRERVLPGV